MAKRRHTRHTAILYAMLMALPSVALATDVSFSSGHLWRLTNPASSGAYDELEAAFGSKVAWTGFDDAPTTYLALADLPRQIRGGYAGFYLVHDRGTVLRQTYWGFDCRRPVLPMMDIGIRLGGVSRSASFTGGDLLNPHDPVAGAGTRMGPDIGVGFRIHSGRLDLEGSFLHLNRPDLSLLEAGSDKLDRLTVARARVGGGMIWGLATWRSQGITSRLDLGFELRTPSLSFGLVLEGEDRLISLLGFRVGTMDIAYAYDFAVSDTDRTPGGSHEILVSFSLGEVDRERIPKPATGPNVPKIVSP